MNAGDYDRMGPCSLGHSHFSEEPLSRPTSTQQLVPLEKILAKSMKVCVYDYSSDGWIMSRGLQINLWLLFLCSLLLFKIQEVKPVPPTPIQSSVDLHMTSSSSPSISQSQVYPEMVGNVSSPDRDNRIGSSTSWRQLDTDCMDTRPMPVLKQSLASPTTSRRTPPVGTRPQGMLHKGEGCEPTLLTSTSASTTEPASNRHPPIPAGMEETKHASSEHYILPLTDSTHTMASSNGIGHAVSAKNLPSKSTTRQKAAEVWETHVAPLLDALDPHSSDIDRLCATCDDLFAVLEQEGMLGKTGGMAGTKRRGVLLRVVFGMLGHKDSKLLTKLARIILSVRDLLFSSI